MSHDAPGDAQKEPELAPGTLVGEYRIEAKLGEGGFGSVYRAVHPLIGKAAAVKVLNRQWSANPAMVQRFVAEARAVNQIRHRNIIDIFSFGQLEDGRQYYVMELLEGRGLEEHLVERGPIPPEVAIPMLRQVARALDAAHGAGIAHRDLKPDNVFLVIDEEGGIFPKLLDFGIAKLLTDSSAEHKTRTGTPMGTPHYMSPEQCRGKDVDQRTDIYSFGVMTHRVLTGQLPFDADDVLSILVKHTTASPPPMSMVLASLPAALDAPVLHMLEKEPERRPPTLLDAMEELTRAAGLGGAPGGATSLSAAAIARSQATTLPAPEGARRGSLAVWIGVGAVAAIAAAGALVASRGGAASDPPRAPATSAHAAPEPPASPAPAAASSAPVVVTPTEDVEVTVQATPATAEVFLGASRLGTAPGPFKVKRSDEKLKLTVKAAGYKPFDVDIHPSANVLVPVTLARVAGGGARPVVPGALENPF
ncbi:MAG: serine/threonine protein kinase [Polyangiaceae bacterium]|nr:serine/threonine protein kinase [Polyangiaceae bacterium]